MSNHLHLVARCSAPGTMSWFLRDFKNFTSKKFIETIQNTKESGGVWLLEDRALFFRKKIMRWGQPQAFAAMGHDARRSGRAENFKIWKDDNHAISLSNIDAFQEINYIHDNPVRNGLVNFPDHYVYSSATNSAGKTGLVKVIVG